MDTERLVEEYFTKNEVSVPDKPLSSLFNRECPRYLSYGMTYEQFWEDSNANLPIIYRKKHEYDINQMNMQAYLTGTYVLKAIAMALGGEKANNLLDKPELLDLSINKEIIESQKEAEAKARYERMLSMIHRVNANMKNKQKEK